MPVTFEARLAFVLFFFFVWCLIGLVPWTLFAVYTRGRGALLALPLALAAACAFGVCVPLVGWRDLTGFLASMAMALIGGTLGAVAGASLSSRILPRPPEPRPGIPAPAERSRRRR